MIGVFRKPQHHYIGQRDRRNALLVATAANDLAPPLLAPQGRYFSPPRPPMVAQRRYFDPSLLTPAVTDVPAPNPPETYTERRSTIRQRSYISDPSLLSTALLENELLGGAETAKRTNLPVTHSPRWWMPQQPDREASGLLDTALLEIPPGPRSSFTDRRQVPQQRTYYDPGLLTTVFDPLSVAFGAGGTYWHLYNDVRVERRSVPQPQRESVPETAQPDELPAPGDARRYQAATHAERRSVPAQRRYFDPGLLTTALLESPLLWIRPPQFVDRRGAITAPGRWSDPGLFAVGDDPLTVAMGVGGDLWRRLNTPATHGDRRESTTQPSRQTVYFDAGPDVPPLTLAWGAGGGYWHRYNAGALYVRAWARQSSIWALFDHLCTITRPITGVTLRPGGTTVRPSGTTTRPGTGITIRPDSGSTTEPC